MQQKLRPLLIALIFLTAISGVCGQTRREKLENRGDAYAKLNRYTNAIKAYKKAWSIKSGESVLKKIANSYKQLHKPQKALKWFKKLTRINNKYYLDYGITLKQTGKYKQARVALEYYLSSYPGDSLAKHHRASIDSALRWKKNPAPCRIKNLKNVNTKYSEVAPAKYKTNDQIVFSSNREKTFIKKKTGDRKLPHFNFFKTKKDGKSWEKPQNFSPVLNSPSHEMAAAFSPDYKKIYFTREKKEYSKDSGKTVKHLKLYKASKNLLGWSHPLVFYLNDTICSFGHPYISQGNRFFFFVSDMPGGYGGTDIYVCLRKDSIWSDPYNLGPHVNTSGNELFPYLKEPEGTLYFSSNGHKGMGGYDLYKAQIQQGDFKKIANLRPPFNSPYDDLSLIFTGKDKGYFSSNRKEGQGREDLYYFKEKKGK